MKTFNDWKQENLAIDDLGTVMIPTKRVTENPNRLDGKWLSAPCFDDFEKLWDEREVVIQEAVSILEAIYRRYNLTTEDAKISKFLNENMKDFQTASVPVQESTNV